MRPKHCQRLIFQVSIVFSDGTTDTGVRMLLDTSTTGQPASIVRHTPAESHLSKAEHVEGDVEVGI
jgi:hypothetical protein